MIQPLDIHGQGLYSRWSHIPIMDSQQTLSEFSKLFGPDLTSERNVESPLVQGAKKLCACGCGKVVITKIYHKFDSIPNYIRYHYNKTVEAKLKKKKQWKDPDSKYNTEEYRKKIAMGGKNRINTEEYRKKCSLAKLKEKNPNYGKIPKHLKDIHKNWMERDLLGYKEHQRKAGMKAFRSCPRISSLENKFSYALKRLKLEFISQFDYKIGYADFLIKPNKIIFIDGDFWHGNKVRFSSLSKNQKQQQKIDNNKSDYLKDKGYEVVRIWENDIKNLNEKELDIFILELLNKKELNKKDKQGYYYIPEAVSKV